MLYLLLWTELKPYTYIRRFVFYQFLLFLCCCWIFFFVFTFSKSNTNNTQWSLALDLCFEFPTILLIEWLYMPKHWLEVFKKKYSFNNIFFCMFILIELLFGSIPKTGSVDFALISGICFNGFQFEMISSYTRKFHFLKFIPIRRLVIANQTLQRNLSSIKVIQSENSNCK